MAIVKFRNKDLFDPLADLKSLQDEINDLFNTDRSPITRGLFDRNFSPAIDVVDNEDAFTVLCEIPGLTEKDIEVSIASNVLTIKGEKKEEKEDKKYFKKETWSGSFQRTIPFPGTADSENISAHLEDGILKIVLPKKEEAKPKQISVTVK